MKHIACIFLAVFFFYACHKDNDANHEYEKEEYDTISLGAQTQLVLRGLNGNIIINGVPGEDNMVLHITKIVRSDISVDDAEIHMSDISVIIEEEEDIYISVDHPQGTGIDYAVNFTITLPYIFDFDIELGNGNISMESTSRNITIDVGNGNTSADVVLLDVCSVNIVTGNGNINLYIPRSTNASLSASVGNGTISSTGLTIQDQQYSGTTLTGEIGSGVGEIILNTGNGNIKVSGTVP